ncbi:3-phosphoshikimate 1-carboxyvinyltransferase [Aeromicrobium fastidiosum]|uniref:3-phosphoshikimate 1-carboxyvinyltransferase n=1 Tax=Aeromicrobium fastidiosum TaxID=52699 RepID=A0A641AHT6_9ACTN|nr:3-phosphoshikimate 1-carboxyvinyltransferase [Aeromicrobium fastidiosum]KAA1373686.1 3-phosphoshikimate 1-carboxyvinyltransferase [Aeromicrobium fastidiosum]MBP2391244.1 3-phosphoshikimate 1-carboxyvinyltransferase [Aeromicrobium fastidiosum]
MTAPLPWLAPHRTSPFVGEVLVPGSKSLTNRVLILAALGDGPSTVTRPLGSRDTQLMTAALTALGATVQRDAMTWTVTPIGSASTEPVTIDCGLAGTVMRFVPLLAALGSAPVTFDGDEHARIRPMATTIATLRALGLRVDDEGRGSLPFTVHGTGHVAGGEVSIDASASSQFVSALLLVGARLERGLDLRHTGSTLPSMPHIEMTVAELRRRGVRIDVPEPGRWIVHPGTIDALDVEIEPDLSNAGVFIAGALVTGGSVRIRSWPHDTDQAGDAWRTIVPAFGGTVRRDGDDLVFAAGDRLRGVELDLHDVGELTPVIAAIAALADTPSRLSGVAHLRGHETDRLAALVTEINRLGGDAEETEDGLVVRPRTLHGDTFRTYDDHRMAHAAVVLGLRVPDLLVENVVTTVKTYPNFAPVWERLMTSD